MTEKKAEKVSEHLELDELYGFIEKKPCTETRENIYIMSMLSREPRKIIRFDVAFDKLPELIQNIVNDVYESKHYYINVYNGYIDIIYPVNIFMSLYFNSCKTKQMFCRKSGNTESCY